MGVSILGPAVDAILSRVGLAVPGSCQEISLRFSRSVPWLITFQDRDWPLNCSDASPRIAC